MGEKLVVSLEEARAEIAARAAASQWRDGERSHIAEALTVFRCRGRRIRRRAAKLRRWLPGLQRRLQVARAALSPQPKDNENG